MLKIDVTGVVPEKRDQARKELDSQFSQLVVDLGMEIEIIVPKDFDQAINSILAGKLGVKIPYNAKRTAVLAIAKTIPMQKKGKLGFIIVLSSTAFGRWEDENIFWRLLTLTHETIHLLDEKALYDDLGAQKFFDEPKTCADVFFRLADDVWMEYHAERFSIEIFIKSAKEMDPKATVDFNLHKGYINSFADLLEKLPGFIEDTVTDFRNWKMTIDEFWSKMYLRLRETLILAAFTSAQSDVHAKVFPKLAEIRSDRNYGFFFDLWNQIEIKLRESYSTEKRYDKTLLTEISTLLQYLFEKCGMKISNIADGIYVAVQDPKLD